MASTASQSVRLRELGFHLPGDPIALDSIEMPEDLRAKVAGIGQEFTFCSNTDSTEMAITAARDTMVHAGQDPEKIGLVISAPTLLTSYGFEIPAIALKASLGLKNADCLNVAQGCVGFLVAMKLAAQFLQCEPDRGDVLVVTACKASSLMDGFTHGAFFWADAAAAAVVTADPGPGIHVEAYREVSSDLNWGAMQLAHGDGADYSACIPQYDLKVVVDFPDDRAQADYIMGEQDRCGALIDDLLAAAGLKESDIDGVFLPSIGKNRVPLLLAGHKSLKEKVRSDFSYSHMGGVDVLFFLDKYLKQNKPDGDGWYLAMTPAFTAQWGGLLIRYTA